MKYSKLLIPVAALFAFSSCSPKVSSGVAATEINSNASSASSTPIEANSRQASQATNTTTTSSQQGNGATEITLPASR